MTTLITGGGSNVGSHLALLLKASGRDAIFASRSGNRLPEGFKTVKLDWKDPSTFEGALNASPSIEYVYIVGNPTDPDTFKDIIPFIDAAVKKGGIKKFIYLSASLFLDRIGVTQIPKYLRENHIDHVILRPTWFIDNLAASYISVALKTGTFETSVATGRIPFVATEDIAVGAFKAITEDIVNKDMVIIGPELLTYDEFAQAASDSLGRTIVHKPVSGEELVQNHGEWVKVLLELEILTEEDRSEEKWWNISAEDAEKDGIVVFKGTTTVRDWVTKHKGTKLN